MIGLAFWVAAVGAAASLGMLSEMSVLQRRPASRTAPIIFAAMIFVPVVLAPALADERWSSNPPTTATLLGCLLLVLYATISLARSPSLATVLPSGAQPAAT